MGEKQVSALSPSPLEESIIAGTSAGVFLYLVEHGSNTENLIGEKLPLNPFPKCRAEIQAICTISGCHKDIRIEKVFGHGRAPTFSPIALKVLELLIPS